MTTGAVTGLAAEAAIARQAGLLAAAMIVLTGSLMRQARSRAHAR